jgi:hypothetical protein
MSMPKEYERIVEESGVRLLIANGRHATGNGEL